MHKVTVSHKLGLIVHFSNLFYAPQIPNIPLNTEAKLLSVLPLEIV